MADDAGCGELFALYEATRAGDGAAVRSRWEEVSERVSERDSAAAQALDERMTADDVASVRALTADLLFEETDPSALDGPLACLVGTLLYAFGYVASFVLFVGADSPGAVVRRLRWAYRTVGVDIQDAETANGVERTTFRCPYRNLGADRWGQRRLCHDVLDRVDDGYVTFLDRHRDLDYRRPRPCAASECCYSEVEAP